jgi:L-histidine N-alpha-methyltransferase
MIAPPITIEIHSVGRRDREELITEVRAGLARRPKELHPRWFYDERGSQLFEEITQLPEYYLTRTEVEILEQYAPEIVAATLPGTIAELGAGSSTKTRILMDAAWRAGILSRFVPFDVSAEIVERAARELIDAFPGLTVHAVIGSFDTHMDRIPRFGRQLIAFLGSTIGNFDDQEQARFLSTVRRLLHPGDAFLLGVDLVKDPGELTAAYNDAAGLTAEFNRNMLAVLNHELEADFELRAFEHAAVYNAAQTRIEMYLRSTHDQWVRIPGAGLRIHFDDGERLRTEISVKFTRPMVEAALARAGMRVTGWYTDSRARFALVLGATT